MPDLYTADRSEARRGGRFRWFFSTCLAAGVGGIAIIVVIFGAADPDQSRGGMLPTLRRMGVNAHLPQQAALIPVDGLKWALPKSDRLQAVVGAAATKFIVQDSIRQRRGRREYIRNKPYARILVRLGAVSIKDTAEIPPFNPFKLYANNTPVGSGDVEGDGAGSDAGQVTLRVVELLGGNLPTEDGQEMDYEEVADLIRRLRDAQREQAEMKPAFLPDGMEVADAKGRPGARWATAGLEPTPPNTSILEKTVFEPDEAAEDLDGREVRRIKVSRGETLIRLLQTAGADAWMARSMAEAARSVFPETALAVGQDVELVMAPSLTKVGRLEPIRFTIFDAGAHRVTVDRTDAGEFYASATPLNASGPRAAGRTADRAQASSLYASLYQAGLLQGLPTETIEQILRIHAYETDFRRRAKASDTVELFFDVKDDDRGADGPTGELLYTAMTAGGDTHAYYRFRSRDGRVDYYDEYGSNARKFLMRRPVRSEDVRLASGFGVRFHPLLNTRRMHTGIDWATASGTPVLASGTGVVEEVGPKGQYGNYIRLRHANGYQTAYGHMSRFAQGVEKGVKVRQGQVIGYVGTTGFSTGAHLHYEVLVNNRFVDPLSIQVPQERKLTGRELADFQKERLRLDELMRRPPVRVAQVEGQ